MKLLSRNLFTLFTMFASKVNSSSIPTKKICKDCKHFIGDRLDCKKFGNVNIITGDVTYLSARSVREDENKCGEDAILFENNRLKFITIPYYFVKENSLTGLLTITTFGVASLYFYALAGMLKI